MIDLPLCPAGTPTRSPAVHTPISVFGRRSAGRGGMALGGAVRTSGAMSFPGASFDLLAGAVRARGARNEPH